MLITSFTTALILANIRKQFDDPLINIDAYIVPPNGLHYGGGVAPCEARVAAVSGFTGTSQSVIITETEALLWVDGRYFIQAENQVDANWTVMKSGEPGVPTESDWLVQNLSPSSRVGVDGWLYPKSEWDAMSAALAAANMSLVDLQRNLVDQFWVDRPLCTRHRIDEFPVEFSGKSISEKLEEVRCKMQLEGADLLLLSELDDIAWLFNLRGTDVGPTFYAYALINSTGAELVVSDGVNADELEDILIDENVLVYEHHHELDIYLEDRLPVMGGDVVWLSKYVSARIASLIEETHNKKVILKLSPVVLLKAIKNPVEVTGIKDAHLRDSAAIVAFLSWIETKIMKDKLQNITEISAAAKLLEIRKADSKFVMPSFETISGFGPNGAIIHYRPTKETDIQISDQSLYLLDSGGQYKEGTTDITRTVHFGQPTEEQKDRFTRVLKGHIAIAQAIFPFKTTGHRLDGRARKALWDAKLDYKHGSGHGIGHYLYVHEGPQSIGSAPSEDDTGLQENMFVSNEPGFYKDNDFGIRTENIVRVINTTVEGFLSLETVSFVPIQLKLIDVQQLTSEEIAWLDQYHIECREKVGEFIRGVNYIQDKETVLEWLQEATVTWDEFSAGQRIFLSSVTLGLVLSLQLLLTRYLI